MNVMGRRRSHRLAIGACVLVVLLFLLLRHNEIVESSIVQTFRPQTDIDENIGKPHSPLIPLPQPKQPANDTTTDVETHPPEDKIEHKPQEPFKAPSHGNSTLAIMTTVLDPDPTFSVWLDYHLRRFDLVIVFLDDPSERPKLEQLVKDRPVVFFNGSTAWSDSAPDRLVYRQQENVNAAIAYAMS